MVSTPLKNISQLEGLSHILWKIKHVSNHQAVIIATIHSGETVLRWQNVGPKNFKSRVVLCEFRGGFHDHLILRSEPVRGL